MTRHTSDLDLAERAARGDARATAELVNRALPIVRGLAHRLAADSEEGDALAQEAFAAALEGLYRYRGDAAFATWLCSIAVRRHADIRRSATAEERVRQRTAIIGQREPAEIVADMDSAQRIWQLQSLLLYWMTQVWHGLPARDHGQDGRATWRQATSPDTRDSVVALLPQAFCNAIIARATSEGPADAAVRLGITTNAMRVRLHRARLALRELLLARYPDWFKEVTHAKR